MELKSPKAKKKSSVARLVTWSKMFRTPLLVLLLLGTSTCDEPDSTEDNVPISNITFFKEHLRHRHNHIQPSFNSNESELLSDIRYLRRHLKKEIVNFVMTDVLVDGEIENRVHYNGITAKETFVGIDGHDGNYNNRYKSVQESTEEGRTNFNTESTQNINTPEKKKKKTDIPSQIIDILKSKKTTPIEDDDTKFLMSFRSDLKDMSKIQKLNFKAGMLKLLQRVTDDSRSLSRPPHYSDSNSPSPTPSNHNIINYQIHSPDQDDTTFSDVPNASPSTSTANHTIIQDNGYINTTFPDAQSASPSTPTPSYTATQYSNSPNVLNDFLFFNCN